MPTSLAVTDPVALTFAQVLCVGLVKLCTRRQAGWQEGKASLTYGYDN